MKQSSTFLLLILLMSYSAVSFAQRSQRKQQFKPSEVDKMPIVLLDLVEKSYPKSHLQKVSNSSITIINRTVHEITFKPMYFSGDVALDQINSIVVYSRKRRFRTNLIGAVAGGALGYFVGKQLEPSEREAGLDFFYPRKYNVPSVIGGVIGASIGAVIGDLFTPLHIDHVNTNPKQAVAKLKEYAPSRRSAKSKRKRRR